MKQITMDFETYEEELIEARTDGMADGEIEAWECALRYLHRPYEDAEMNDYIRGSDDDLSQLGIAKKRFIEALLAQKSSM